MRVALAIATLVVGCNGTEGGAGLCTERTFCDGDLIYACRTHCRSEFDCERIVTLSTDCEAYGDTVGIAYTCGELTTSNGSSEYTACVPVAQQACDPSMLRTLECVDGTAMMRMCTPSPDGGVWITSQFCTGGKLCHPVDPQGVFCYEPPGEPCQAQTPQYCDPDGKTLVQCSGTPAAGYILQRYTCPNTCGLGQGDAYYCM